MAFLIDPKNNAPILSPDAIDRRRKVADAYMTASRDTAPIQSWTQGAAKLADALVGGLVNRKADSEEQQGREGANASMARLIAAMTGDKPTVNPGVPALPAAGAAGQALKTGSEVGLGDIFSVAQNPYLSDAQGGIVSALLGQKMDAMKPRDPIKLGAGDTLYDPTSMKPVFTAPAADTTKPMAVAEGSMLYDPATKQWITPPTGANAYRPATAEEKQAYGVPADAPLMIGPGGKPGILGSGSTTVNVAGAEKGYDKTLGEGLGKEFLDLNAEARKAQDSITSLSSMEMAMNDPTFYSGPGGDTVLAIKRGIATLGGDPGIAASAEAFNAQAKKAALDNMGGSLGTGFSNADRDFVVGQVPSLGNTPEGNRLLVQINKAIQQRKIDIAQLARDYANKHEGRIDIGFDDALREFAESHPLFDKNMLVPKPQPPGAPVTIDGVTIQPWTGN